MANAAKLKERKRMEQLAAEADCEVEVNWIASGDVLDVIADYADYMRREMPHVNRLRASETAKIVACIEKLDVGEIDKKWRFEFCDDTNWDASGDQVTRVLSPSNCRGDEWRKLMKLIRMDIPACSQLDEYHQEDVAIYGIIKALIAGSFKPNLKLVFGLGNDNGRVVFLLDSCCFDPHVKGGDTLHLDAEVIAKRIAFIREVFKSNALHIECKGGLETVIDNGLEDDDISSEEDGELDDSESDFIVDDD